MTDDDFERYWREHPESKIELIDGHLVIGNGMAGSRYMLREMLATWGPTCALPLALERQWRLALCEAFADDRPPRHDAALADWNRWAAGATHVPQVISTGPRDEAGHRAARQRLYYGLFGVAHDTDFARVLGRDFTMKLGENGFAPDVLVMGPSAKRLRAYYLDGPADVVMEVLLPGHESQDREFKRDRYEQARVGEYWIVDPRARHIDFLVLRRGRFHAATIDNDGRYRSAALPGLALVLDRLWRNLEEDSWAVPHFDPPLFEVNGAQATWDCKRGPEYDRGVEWGALPFRPEPQLDPRDLRFDQFVSWCPEAKFEMIDGKPLIGGHLGTKHLLGMLLRTFGLTEAVKLLTPSQWVAALESAEAARRHDPQRREAWWREVRQAATLLREHFGLKHVSVIGDLTGTEPLNEWSDVTLVVRGVPKGVHLGDAYHKLHQANPDTCIADLRDEGSLWEAQRQELEERGGQL